MSNDDNKINIVNFNNKVMSSKKVEGTDVKVEDDEEAQKNGKYFINLFLPIEEKENGVYTMNLKEKWIRTIDKDGNSFEINSKGETRTFISVSFNLKQDGSKWDVTPRYKGTEYLDPVNLNLPKPKNWKDPILLIINGDNTGTQLLTEKMLSEYWMDKKNSKSTIVSLNENVTNSTGIMVLEDIRENNSVELVPYF